MRSSLIPVAVRTRRSCRPSGQSAAILILALTLLSSTFLSETRRDPGLVVEDLLGIAQPCAGKRDLELGAALAADRADRAQRGRGRAPLAGRQTRKQNACSLDRSRQRQARMTERIRRGCASSGQQLLDHLAAVDDLDGPVAGGHQLLVGDDAEQVIDGRGEVFGADRVALGLAGRRVRRGRRSSPA